MKAIMNIQKIKFLLFLPLFLLCAGCDLVTGPFPAQAGMAQDASSQELGEDSTGIDSLGTDGDHHNIQVDTILFSQDYKTISVKLKMPEELANHSLTDSTKIRIATEESSPSCLNDRSNLQPVLTRITNIRKQELADKKYSLLLLVDLTLSAEEIAEERKAIEQIRSWFPPSSLHIAFLKSNGVTEDYLASDYVMNTYFRKSGSRKFLYRSILAKMDDLRNWTSLSREQKALVVFSNGDVYNKDFPIDPQHFELQKELLQTSTSSGYSSVYYVNSGTYYGEGEGNEAQSIMQHVCERTNGLCQSAFNWNSMLSALLDNMKMDYADYQLDFTNPDHKTYSGKATQLNITIYEKGELLGTACAHYKIGSIYTPVIINGLSDMQIALIGILTVLFILAITYLVTQILVPYVSYQLFKRRYITHYTTKGMVFNGIQVDQSCYYCKAPFEEGDEIVAKCKHVMHKSCWEENEYKCPEYGRKCKEGSHYYNSTNLFDCRNAPYLKPWIIAGIIAALLGWLLYLGADDRPSNVILNKFMLSIHGLKEGTAAAQNYYDNYAESLKYLPIFGLCQNIFLSFAISYLSLQTHPITQKLKIASLKALSSGILGYLAFMLACFLSIILNLKDGSIIIDCIPWVLNSIIIAYVSTFGTRIRLSRKLIGISIVVGLVVMYMWIYFVFYDKLDYRGQILLCFIIYSVAIAVCVAAKAPRTERYFLHVEGALKPMDIALYKWLRTSPDFTVTIGKSVDCHLQMTWDFASNIPPVQATIFIRRGNIYMQAQEEGVEMDGKPLSTDSKVRLYHGRKFTIGKTTFTFEEKDGNAEYTRPSLKENISYKKVKFPF